MRIKTAENTINTLMQFLHYIEKRGNTTIEISLTFIVNEVKGLTNKNHLISEEKMFKNISKKLVAMSYIILWSGIIASAGFGIYTISLDYPWSGFAIISGGTVLSILAAFIINGFSKIVNHFEADEDNSDSESGISTSTAKDTSDTASVESENPRKKCELCGQDDCELIDCEIIDNLGTRYRSICPKCKKEKNAREIKIVF